MVVSFAPVQPSGCPRRNRAAVDVEAIGDRSAAPEAGERLRRECLVQLDDIHLVEREPRELQRLPDRRDRPDAETLRLDARRCERDEPRQRRQAARLREAPFVTTTAAAPSLVCDELPQYRARHVEVPGSFGARLDRVAPRTFMHRDVCSTVRPCAGIDQSRAFTGRECRGWLLSKRSRRPAVVAHVVFSNQPVFLGKHLGKLCPSCWVRCHLNPPIGGGSLMYATTADDPPSPVSPA